MTRGTEANDWRRSVTVVLSALLVLFTLAEVNYPQLSPQSQLAIFAGPNFVANSTCNNKSNVSKVRFSVIALYSAEVRL